MVVSSAFSTGKTWLAGRLVGHWISTDASAIAITTASVGRSVSRQLWGEIRQLHSRYALAGRLQGVDDAGGLEPLPGTLLPQAAEWRISPSNFALGFSTKDPNKFAGWHGGRVLLVLDEAEGIPEGLWDIMEGQLASADVAVLAIGNPDPSGIGGGFERAARSALWHHITISAFDTPNLVAGRDDVMPNLVTCRWVEERRGEWGEEHPLWKTKVLGQFVEGSGARHVVILAWYERAERASGLAAVGSEPQAGLDIARFGCFDDQTEILTNEGWKFFADLDGAEQVMTLRPDCVAEWGPITKVHCYQHEGWMNLHDAEKVNYCVTDNHRLAWRQKWDAEDVFRVGRYDELPKRWIVKRSNAWEGKNPETISFHGQWRDGPDTKYQREYARRKRGYTQTREWEFSFLDWAEFLGWFVAEGNVYQEKRAGGRKRILIAQRGEEKMRAIEDLLTRMGIQWRRTSTTGRQIEFCNNAIGAHLIEHCGSGAHNKRIPLYLKEAGEEALEAFIAAFRLGDGCVKRDGSGRCHNTSSRLLADDLQEMLVKLGRAGRLSMVAEVGSVVTIEGRRVVRQHNVYRLGEWSARRDAWLDRKDDQRVWYKGDVYCVTTPNGTIAVRRKGVPMWSGNSDDSAIAIRQGPVVRHLERIHGFDGVQVGSWAIERMRQYGCKQVNGDSSGLGGPVLDVMRQTSGIHVTDVNAGERAKDPEKFVRRRDELWWTLRERFEQDRLNLSALDGPTRARLRGQVCSITYDYRLGGRIEVESKDSLKRRGLPSPDDADALCLAFTVQTGRRLRFRE